MPAHRVSPLSIRSEPAQAGSRTWNSDLAQHAGERVSISGWLHHRRALKSVCFLILRDASGLAHVVVEAAATRAEVESLPHESVLTITGDVVASPQAPNGIEMH